MHLHQGYMPTDKIFKCTIKRGGYFVFNNDILYWSLLNHQTCLSSVTKEAYIARVLAFSLNQDTRK